MFNDSILMPPPAPRFKRSRTEDEVDESKVFFAATTRTTMTAACMKDSITMASSAVYDDDYVCISPEDDDNAQDRSNVNDLNECNIESSAIEFKRLENIDANFKGSFVHNDNKHGQDYHKEREQEEEAPIKKRMANYREERGDNIFIPNTKFCDIIGQGPAKLRLDEALLPLALPGDLADSVLTGIRAAPVSILLHGPPGCGKTKLAQAVAGEARAAFWSVGPSDVLSKFVGESEASIRGLFREARRKARTLQSKCAVIFFDEIDALGRSRIDEETGAASQAAGDNSSRRILAELLIQMTELAQSSHIDDEESDDEEYDHGCDEGGSLSEQATTNILPSSLDVKDDVDNEQQEVGTPTRDIKLFINNEKSQSKSRVIVIAATNRPEDCDPALLRRFAVRVLVALPSKRDRKKIIQRLLLDVQHSISPIQLEALAQSTEGWSGSDLESMTREAVMAPVRETLREAAILKKRATKAAQQQQRSGAGSSEENNDNAADLTRESLLNGFRNLRPVSCKDFEDGIAFFLGEQENESGFGQFGGRSRLSHYDSSDSSEDEAHTEEQ